MTAWAWKAEAFRYGRMTEILGDGRLREGEAPTLIWGVLRPYEGGWRLDLDVEVADLVVVALDEGLTGCDFFAHEL